MATVKEVVAAPYIPLKSLMTALDYLQQGIPLILDRSVWPTFSGGLGTQLLAAFRFFGFINEEHETLPLLERAVDPDRRKEALREAVQNGYSALLEMDLTRATPRQLSEFLSELYSVTGSTHKKAMTFFLHVAKYIELPLSPAITRNTRASAPRKRRAAPIVTEDNEDEENDDLETPTAKKQGGSSRTIKLRGGGTATLIFDVDVSSMTTDDQAFVFEMIRRLTEYEQKQSANAEGA